MPTENAGRSKFSGLADVYSKYRPSYPDESGGDKPYLRKMVRRLPYKKRLEHADAQKRRGAERLF